MKALVLEEKGKLSLRDFDIPGTLGPKDVKIRTHTVGIAARMCIITRTARSAISS